MDHTLELLLWRLVPARISAGTSLTDCRRLHVKKDRISVSVSRVTLAQSVSATSSSQSSCPVFLTIVGPVSRVYGKRLIVKRAIDGGFDLLERTRFEGDEEVVV